MSQEPNGIAPEPQEAPETPGQPQRRRKKGGEPPAPPQERQPLHDSLTRLLDLRSEEAKWKAERDRLRVECAEAQSQYEAASTALAGQKQRHQALLDAALREDES